MSVAPEAATADYRQPSAREVITQSDPAREHHTRFCPQCDHQNPSDRPACLICTALNRRRAWM
jgi:hypothetical protein